MAIDPVAIRDAFYTNADYAESDSLTKARAFESACRRAMLCPQELEKDGERIRFPDARVLADMLKDAQAWISTNVDYSGGGVRHLDFEGYRD